jgi:hypothetical protein
LILGPFKAHQAKQESGEIANVIGLPAMEPFRKFCDDDSDLPKFGGARSKASPRNNSM